MLKKKFKKPSEKIHVVPIDEYYVNRTLHSINNIKKDIQNVCVIVRTKDGCGHIYSNMTNVDCMYYLESFKNRVLIGKV